MIENILYYTFYWWLPVKWRIKLENGWYWLTDAPVYSPPHYDRLEHYRTKKPYKGENDGAS